MTSEPLTFGSLFAGIEGFGAGMEDAGMKCVWQVEIDEKCRSVLARHFPNSERFVDVREFPTGDVVRPDIVCGGFPCFPAGAMVLCKDGFKDISTIVVGDMVLSHTGKWRRVTRTFEREAATVELRGHGHPAMVTTHNHPFWSVSQERKWRARPHGYERCFDSPQWRNAEDMEGKYWASPVVFPKMSIPAFVTEQRERIPCVQSEEFWWLVGVWLGDGWLNLEQRSQRPVGQTNGKVFICANREQATVIEEAIRQVGLHATRTEERTTTRFVICSKPLARWLLFHFGRYAHGKKIPSWLLGADGSIRQSVLEGFVWADGSQHGEHRQKCTSINKTLLVGVKLLAQSVGRSVAMHTATPNRICVIEGRQVRERPQWQLVIESKGRSSVVIGDHRFGLVRSVKETGRVEIVYDIEVETDHSFLVDGIAVHNCQDLSVAGKRAGLGGERSGLWHEFRRIVALLAPPCVLIENVPGLCSSWSGDTPMSLGIEPGPGGEMVLEERSDLDIVTRGLAELGYRWAYASLDAQYFGVAQRRERVFIVGCLGSWPHPAKILFDAESLQRDSPPRRETGARVAASLTRGSASGGGVNEPGRRREDDVNIVVNALDAHMGMGGVDDNSAQANHLICDEVAATLRSASDSPAAHGKVNGTPGQPFAFDWMAGESGNDDSFRGKSRKWITRAGDYAGAIGATKRDGVLSQMQVRRLTPLECERLQGFPDGWTRYGANGEEMSDSARYRMLGNAVCRKVGTWIARRILVVTEP